MWANSILQFYQASPAQVVLKTTANDSDITANPEDQKLLYQS